MAMKVSATVMITSGGEDQRLLDEDQELFHGGDLGAARRRFPGAPEPFIDLSTGINPYPYPVPRTQIVLPIVARLVPPGRAAVLTPGYAEHGRAAALAGHKVEALTRLDDCGGAALVIVANPNNPD